MCLFVGLLHPPPFQIGQQTETLAGEVNLTFSGSKQMSMEVGQDGSGENVSLPYFCLQSDIGPIEVINPPPAPEKRSRLTLT